MPLPTTRQPPRAAPTVDEDTESRAVYASLHGGDYWDEVVESVRQQYRDAVAAGRAARTGDGAA